MRYQNLKSFHKHLASSAPHHLCRVYLVAIADDFERSQAIDSILSHIPDPPHRFSGADCNLLDVLDAMHSFSLFGETPVVVLDEAEKLAKKEMQTLCEKLAAPAGFVLLGARSKTILASRVEQEGVILDLLDEKPWDKEKRLADWLQERAKNEGKRLSPEAIPLLFERVGMDPAQLESEMDKLICYVGEHPQITREDILRISPASRSATVWQTAEEVVWEGGDFTSLDGSAFHSLLPVLRNQLTLGLKLAVLIEERRPSDQWSRYLPKIWPKTLEKRSSQAARFGSPYFRKGLEKLFEMELLSRSHSTQYRALLDRFRAQIHVW